MTNITKDIYRFEKTSDNTWAENYKGFIATITYTPGLTPYSLSVTGIGLIGNYDTRKLAVSAFKRFLSDKPVLI